MIITTAATIAGHRIVMTFGLVRGSTVRSRHVGRDIMGEVASYTTMMEDARSEALQRLITGAEAHGANAVTDLRFSTAAVMSGAAEVLAYGTAVTVEPA